jgi:hypothetical protein
MESICRPASIKSRFAVVPTVIYGVTPGCGIGMRMPQRETFGFSMKRDTTLVALSEAVSPAVSVAELRVGTSIAEGTANFLVNRRMNKSQQMRWSRKGADLLLQVRCAVYNGTLGSGLGHRFQPHANQNERSANAA